MTTTATTTICIYENTFKENLTATEKKKNQTGKSPLKSNNKIITTTYTCAKKKLNEKKIKNGL